MGVDDKKINIMDVHWKIRFLRVLGGRLGGVYEKTNTYGGLSKNGDLNS